MIETMLPLGLESLSQTGAMAQSESRGLLEIYKLVKPLTFSNPFRLVSAVGPMMDSQSPLMVVKLESAFKLAREGLFSNSNLPIELKFSRPLRLAREPFARRYKAPAMEVKFSSPFKLGNEALSKIASVPPI